MKELRFKANNGSKIWTAFAFDPEREAIILVAADKQGISEARFYRDLLKKANKRFDQHLAKINCQQKQEINMGRNLDDIIDNLPAERRAKIKTLSQKKVEEMMAHAATLADFRKAVGKTQVEVAKELGIKQNAVSQLESRSDCYLSTLRKVLKSFGVTLELAVITPNGVRIKLPNFLRSNNDTASTASLSDLPQPAAKKIVRARVGRAPRKVATHKKVAASPKAC